jgi:hypothetical protein
MYINKNLQKNSFGKCVILFRPYQNGLHIFFLIFLTSEKHPHHHVPVQPWHPATPLEPDESGDWVRHHPELGVVPPEDPETGARRVHDKA